MTNIVDRVFAKVPLLNTPDIPIFRPSQDVVPVADVVEDIVFYKDGGAAIVLESSSLNFGLLSDREQEAVVLSFASMINSLSFPIQIVVKTQRKNISSYLNYIDQKIAESKNEKLKTLMVGYKNFINETIKKRNVLGKRFFIVIPFSPIELGFSRKSVALPGKRVSGPIPYTLEYTLKKAKTALYPKRDHIIKQCARLGLRAKQLTRSELVELYFDIFNPDVESVRDRSDNKTQ